MTETTVAPHPLKTLEVITELLIQNVSVGLSELAVPNVLLSVEEPVGDLELPRALDNVHKLLDLIVGKFAGSLVEIDVSLFADNSGKTATHTLDGCQSKNDFLLAVNVGVKDTENVLKVVRLY